LPEKQVNAYAVNSTNVLFLIDEILDLVEMTLYVEMLQKQK